MRRNVPFVVTLQWPAFPCKRKAPLTCYATFKILISDFFIIIPKNRKWMMKMNFPLIFQNSRINWSCCLNQLLLTLCWAFLPRLPQISWRAVIPKSSLFTLQTDLGSTCKQDQIFARFKYLLKQQAGKRYQPSPLTLHGATSIHLHFAAGIFYAWFNSIYPFPPPPLLRATPRLSPVLWSRGWGTAWISLVPGGRVSGNSKVTPCCFVKQTIFRFTMVPNSWSKL